jgi:DNA-binding MarR family transcriptional regulator
VKTNRLTPRETTIWQAVKAFKEVVFARIESDIQQASGLSGAEFGVLSRLQDLGNGKLSQQALKESMGWHKARLSHQLTRMEGRDLVQRVPLGRSVVVVILPEGDKALTLARPAHVQAIRKHLVRKVTREEADALLSAFEKLSR